MPTIPVQIHFPSYLLLTLVTLLSYPQLLLGSTVSTGLKSINQPRINNCVCLKMGTPHTLIVHHHFPKIDLPRPSKYLKKNGVIYPFGTFTIFYPVSRLLGGSKYQHPPRIKRGGQPRSWFPSPNWGSTHAAQAVAARGARRSRPGRLGPRHGRRRRRPQSGWNMGFSWDVTGMWMGFIILYCPAFWWDFSMGNRDILMKWSWDFDGFCLCVCVFYMGFKWNFGHCGVSQYVPVQF